jgi:hypothetical protein
VKTGRKTKPGKEAEVNQTYLFGERLPDWFDSSPQQKGFGAVDLRQIQALARTVTGWLSEEQGIALYLLARREVPGDVVEIGSFCGKSTIFAGLGCMESGSKLLTVDPHKSHSEGGKEQYAPDFTPREHGSLAEFRWTLERSGLQPSIDYYVATSEEARNQIGWRDLKLLFIDGSHDYLDVVLDYFLWHPMVIADGYMAIHDSNFDSVNRFIQNHVDRTLYEHDGTVGTGGWAMTLWRRAINTRGVPRQSDLGCRSRPHR